MKNNCCEIFKSIIKNKNLSKIDNCLLASSNVASENKKSFKIETNNKSNYCRIRIDDCIIESEKQKKCDYLFFESTRPVFIFVELKGRELEKAVEQIAQTVEFFKSELSQISKKKAYIVSSSVPRVESIKFEKLRKKFESTYKFSLEHKNVTLVVNENDLFK